MTERRSLSRRKMLRGGLAAAGASLLHPSVFGFVLPPLGAGETAVPFLDPQPVNPDRAMVQWEQLESWITPESDFFSVKHYGVPEVDMEKWKLTIGGFVDRPLALTLADLKARPKSHYTATLECSGNGASERFMGAIGNARWSGTRLGPILEECGLSPEATEVVFFGADRGKEEIRGNEYEQNFGRSLSVKETLRDRVLLAYEMNGKPLSRTHGAPLRLVVPGWYGVAWVKWLWRVEVHDRQFLSRFMGRDYVTIRGEERDGETIWRETSVGRMNLKSIVARVTRMDGGNVRVMGAVWNDGTPLKAVELQVDDGAWVETELGEGKDHPHCWTFWTYDWKDPAPGEHTLVSRAVDARGRVQPAPEDDMIRLKKTYWEANPADPAADPPLTEWENVWRSSAPAPSGDRSAPGCSPRDTMSR